MVLDHTGPDLALIFYGASLKLWIMALLLANLFTAWAAQAGVLPASVLILVALVLVAGLIGTIESITARLRLVKIPQLLIGAGACGILALFLLSR
jgi:formate hydrogenlyase subunit 4